MIIKAELTKGKKIYHINIDICDFTKNPSTFEDLKEGTFKDVQKLLCAALFIHIVLHYLQLIYWVKKNSNLSWKWTWNVPMKRLHFNSDVPLPTMEWLFEANKQDSCVISSSDHEYLVKSGGSVHLHDARTGNSSELLSQSHFVSLLPDRLLTGPCVCGGVGRWGGGAMGRGLQAQQQQIHFCFPPPNGQDARNATDYHLSADRKYVAFVSNYRKVWITISQSRPKTTLLSLLVCWLLCIFISSAVEAFVHSNVFHLRSGIKVSLEAERLVIWSTSVRSIDQIDVPIVEQTDLFCSS